MGGEGVGERGLWGSWFGFLLRGGGKARGRVITMRGVRVKDDLRDCLGRGNVLGHLDDLQVPVRGGGS